MREHADFEFLTEHRRREYRLFQNGGQAIDARDDQRVNTAGQIDHVAAESEFAAFGGHHQSVADQVRAELFDVERIAPRAFFNKV